MHLENVVFDAVDPQRLGRSWEAAIGGQRLTDEPDGFETRLSVEGGPVLDLCFQRVPESPTGPQRLHVSIAGDPALAMVLRLESASPDRDAAFWSWLTGWTPTDAPRTLRHPSMCGPVLELCPQFAPKGPAKNDVHLDVRLEAGDDPYQVAAGITERGGHELHPGWGDLPWRVYADPSGNEFCVLPAR